MNKSNWSIGFWFSLVILLVGFSSCVDKEFDEPPVLGTSDPEIAEPIVTVGEILAKWIPGDFVELADDVAMEAIVIGDDSSGNIYKSLVLSEADGSAGITIIIDQVEMFNVYPVGRKVFVKTKGLYIGDFNGLPQLGTTPTQNGNFLAMGRIPEAILSEVVVPGIRNQVVTPKARTINSLGNTDLNTLVTLSDVEFSAGALNDTYADAVEQQSVNQILEDCDGNSLTIRTSGFADFAGEAIPQGNGSFTAIFGRFGTTDQLTIRNLGDINLTGERCDGGGNTGGGDPTITEPIVKVSEILAKWVPGSFVELTDEVAMETIVIGDDRSGNIFKSLVLSDADGGAGITIIINQFDLYEKYPVGTKVYVKTQGLYIGDFNGLPQIGTTPMDNGGNLQMGRIEENVAANIVIPSSGGQAVTPKSRTINSLSTSDLNTLITLSDVEFSNGSINDTYADADNQFSVNHEIQDCDGNIVVIRTSGYADFAGQVVPGGNGALTVIFGRFGTTDQLLLRETTDANLNGDRCGGNTGGGDCEVTAGAVSIEKLRCLWNDNKPSIGNNSIRGIIVSDVASGNINNQNLQIQDGEFGIVIRFADAHTFALGLEVEIDLSGRTMSEFRGTLQITDVELNDVDVIGMGTLPTPRVATVSEVITNLESWESTLVRIEGVTLSGSSTFDGGLTITDSTGDIATFTRSDANFSGDSVPSGTVNVVAVVGQFDDPQIYFRNRNDIQ